jgi:Arc/MetJ family transcription regulator
MRMKRTNLVLDEDLLEEALRLSGERTYSKTVDRALSEFVRKVRARRILELAGSGLWEGSLAEMRRDFGVGEAKPRRPRRGSR